MATPMCMVGLLWANGMVCFSSVEGGLKTPCTLSLDEDAANEREAIA
jgi:hypothetical protein